VAVAGAALVVGQLSAVAASASGAAPARRGEAASLTIVAQGFTVGPGDRFTATVALPTVAELGAGVTLELTAFEPVDDPAAVRAAQDRQLGAAVDLFRVSLDPASSDASVATITTGAQVQLSVPTSTDPAVPGGETGVALHLTADGVVPVELDVRRSGALLATAITFVHRRTAAAPASGTLPVGLLLRANGAPTIGADGDATLTADDSATLGRLADALTAIDSVKAPRAVQLQPAVLDALHTSDPTLATRLDALLTRSTVIAGPRLPLDPSAAVTAGKQQTYTSWLRDGEDSLAASLPGTRVDRSLQVDDAPVSDAGLQLQRDLGLRVVVMTPERYAAIDGNIGGFADTSQLQTLSFGDGGTIPVLLIDPNLAATLGRTDVSPLQAAVSVAAQLLALVRQIEDLGGSLASHGVLLAAADGGLVDPGIVSRLMPMLSGSPEVNFVDPVTLASTMSTQLVDGQPTRSLTLPASAGPDLTARFTSIAEVTVDEVGTVSMLPSGAPEVATWQRVTDSLASTAVSDAQAASMVGALRTAFDVYRNGVQGPAPFAFTLTGQTSDIRFRVHNATGVALKVRVQMDSAKMKFPDGDQLVTLAPQSATEVTVRVEARTNGTQGVRLSLFTPATDHRLVPDVVLKAQVTALTGLGQLITGALVLVVLTWWVRHLRNRRRAQRAAIVVDRHPAAGTDAGSDASEGDGTGLDGSGLAPDAAASSLPPS
jgi:hypothetical protein